MKKLLISVTNRSSYNKVKTIIENLKGVGCELLLGGSIYLYKYGNAIDVIRKDFPDIPKHRINLAVEGDSLAKMPKSVGLGTVEITTLLDELKPDMVLTIADRFETMATAIAASYMNIPLVHLQGGEITGSIDNKVRNAITQLADWHFPATELAGCYIRRMKFNNYNRVFSYGCPSMDLMQSGVEKYYEYGSWKRWMYLNDIVNGQGIGDEINTVNRYIVVIFHPDTTEITNIKDQVYEFVMGLNGIDTQKIIMWPNIDSGSEHIAKAWREVSVSHPCPPNLTRFIRHFPQEKFSAVLNKSSCIVGNSSTGIREASFLGVPSVNVGGRQRDRERAGNVFDVGFNSIAIRNAIKKQMTQKFKPSYIYGDGQAGIRIAKKLEEILNA